MLELAAGYQEGRSRLACQLELWRAGRGAGAVGAVGGGGRGVAGGGSGAESGSEGAEQGVEESAVPANPRIVTSNSTDSCSGPEQESVELDVTMPSSVNNLMDFIPFEDRT